MKCINCGRELTDNTKFCPECGVRQERKCTNCGASLNMDARFCGECGTYVDGIASGGLAGVLDHIDIVPMELDLPSFNLEISGVEVEEPDDDGDCRITVKYSVTNDTNEDWDYLETRTQIFSSTGQILDESRDTNEQSVGAGETAELEACVCNVKSKLLGSNPAQAHTVVQVIASAFGQMKLGEVVIPASSYEVVPIKSVQLGDMLKLVSGSLWRTDPDDDEDCRVEIMFLVQNLTKQQLPEVKIVAEVTDKQDRELTDAGGSEEVPPGRIVMISGSGYAQAKKLARAKIDSLAMQAYCPVAVGMSQKQGLRISASTGEDEGEEEVFIAVADDPEKEESPANLVCAIFSLEDASTGENYSLVIGHEGRGSQTDQFFKYFDGGANIAVGDSTGGQWDSAWTWSEDDQSFSDEVDPPDWIEADGDMLERLHNVRRNYLELSEDDDGDQFFTFNSSMLDELREQEQSDAGWTAYATENFDDEKLSNFSGIWKLSALW